MRNILIVKTGALGDVLRTTVLLEGLIDKYTNPRVFWLTSELAKPLLENNPFIEQLYYAESLSEDIFSRKYDLVISLEEDRNVLLVVSKIKYLKLLGVFLNDGKIEYTARSSIWYDMSLISRFGKETADKLKKANLFSYPEIIYRMIELNWSKQRYRLFLIKKDIKYAVELKKKICADRPTIGIGIGAGKRWPMKSLPKDLQIKLVKMIRNRFGNKVNILLLTGPDELELSKTNEIKKTCPYVITHEVQDLEQFIGVVNLCNLIITPDSLAAHLGIALNKFVVCYFTVTSPEEIEIYTGKKIVANHKDVCSYTSKDKPRPNITDKINLDEIMESVVSALTI